MIDQSNPSSDTQLSRDYGCLTNNNGLWIDIFDLLTPSCSISRDHDNLQ
jgi:hypothetical protein